MKRWFLLASVLFLVMALPSTAQTDDLDLPVLGMNITAPTYWDNMTYFNDVTRQSWVWDSFDPDSGEWRDERDIPVTENGYPASLEQDQAARMIVFLESFVVPDGDYTLVWEGSGTIGVVVDFAEPMLFDNSVEKRQIVPVNSEAEEGSLFIIITETDPADPIRDIHLYLPGTDENSSTFTPWFMERLAPFGVVRMMNWNYGNHTEVVTWEERPQMDWVTWGTEDSKWMGVPYEVQIELANTLNMDLWISVSHTFDEQHLRNLAELVRDTLNPELRLWIEYSNEAWNPIFPVFEDLMEEAAQVADAENLEDHYIYHQYGRRAGEMALLFDEVFAEQPDRLIAILSGQAGYAIPLQLAVDEVIKQDTLQYFDVLAIAPYFGDTWETSVGSLNALSREYYADGVYSEEEFDAMFAELEAGLDDLFNGVGEYGVELYANRAIAESVGLPLITYEGGQHLVSGYFGNDAADFAFWDVNAHLRMYDLYQQYLNGWANFGGETMVLFHLGGNWNYSETFGHLQNSLQPLEEAHKYRSVLDWLAVNE